MDWFLTAGFIALGIFGLVSNFVHSPKRYQATKVLAENGDEVFIADVPAANLYKGFGRTIKKSAIAKVQLAGNCVSLFTQSNNAIDIWAPNKTLARTVYERALLIFPKVETCIIDH